MKYLFILFVIFSQCVYSQETAATFWNNRCEFKTDGTGKSLGLKIKLSVPCVWTQADGERPHVVKKFSNSFGGGKSITANLTITKMPYEPSQKEISEMFTQQGLKELGNSLGTYISGRKLKIEGIDCGEIIYKIERQSPVAKVYIYAISYNIVYKDKFINLFYASGAGNNLDAKKLFDTYKFLFQGLATNTVILSKWE